MWHSPVAESILQPAECSVRGQRAVIRRTVRVPGGPREKLYFGQIKGTALVCQAWSSIVLEVVVISVHVEGHRSGPLGKAQNKCIQELMALSAWGRCCRRGRWARGTRRSPKFAPSSRAHIRNCGLLPVTVWGNGEPSLAGWWRWRWHRPRGVRLLNTSMLVATRSERSFLDRCRTPRRARRT